MAFTINFEKSKKCSFTALINQPLAKPFSNLTQKPYFCIAKK